MIRCKFSCLVIILLCTNIYSVKLQTKLNNKYILIGEHGYVNDIPYKDSTNFGIPLSEKKTEIQNLENLSLPIRIKHEEVNTDHPGNGSPTNRKWGLPQEFVPQQAVYEINQEVKKYPKGMRIRFSLEAPGDIPLLKNKIGNDSETYDTSTKIENISDKKANFVTSTDISFTMDDQTKNPNTNSLTDLNNLPAAISTEIDPDSNLTLLQPSENNRSATDINLLYSNNSESHSSSHSEMGPDSPGTSETSSTNHSSNNSGDGQVVTNSNSNSMLISQPISDSASKVEILVTKPIIGRGQNSLSNDVNVFSSNTGSHGSNPIVPSIPNPPVVVAQPSTPVYTAPQTFSAPATSFNPSSPTHINPSPQTISYVAPTPTTTTYSQPTTSIPIITPQSEVSNKPKTNSNISNSDEKYLDFNGKKQANLTLDNTIIMNPTGRNLTMTNSTSYSNYLKTSLLTLLIITIGIII